MSEKPGSFDFLGSSLLVGMAFACVSAERLGVTLLSSQTSHLAIAMPQRRRIGHNATDFRRYTAGCAHRSPLRHNTGDVPKRDSYVKHRQETQAYSVCQANNVHLNKLSSDFSNIFAQSSQRRRGSGYKTPLSGPGQARIEHEIQRFGILHLSHRQCDSKQ